MKGKVCFSESTRNGETNVPPQKKHWDEKDTEEKTKIS